jgi:hypothetical protein
MSKAPAAYPKLVDRPSREPEREIEPEELPAPQRDDLLVNVASSVLVYLSMEAHKALARYALDQTGLKAKVKTHDLILEAIQEWVDRKGLNVKVRAKEKVRAGQGARR